MYDLLCLGAIYTDINCLDFPFSDLLAAEETIGSEYQVALGGSAVTSAVVGAKLGLATVFLGKVGKDIFGEWAQISLMQHNVESALIAAEGVRTNLSLNLINSRGDKRMAVVGAANQSLTLTEVESRLKHYLPMAKYLYLGGYFKLDGIVHDYAILAGYAREYGVRIVLDHGRIPTGAGDEELERLRALVSLADIYLPSEGEFKILWGVDDAEKGLRAVHERMASGIVVVKQGSRGAVGVNAQGEMARAKAFSVQPRNTVGAGDSFNAGFLASWMMGADLQTALTFANATAALKISRSELPAYQDVADLCAQET